VLCDAMLCSVKCTSVKLNQSDNNPVMEELKTRNRKQFGTCTLCLRPSSRSGAQPWKGMMSWEADASRAAGKRGIKERCGGAGSIVPG